LYSTDIIQISVRVCVSSESTHGYVQFNINLDITKMSIGTDW